VIARHALGITSLPSCLGTVNGAKIQDASATYKSFEINFLREHAFAVKIVINV